MRKELSFAFRRTIPVMFGYLFLGIAFGLVLQEKGYGFLWAALASITIYAGAGQFVLVGMISGGMSLLSTAVTMLSINSRHIFYGLSFIEKFKAMGKRGLYMIFSLTDETYSLLCSTAVPEGLDWKKTYFLIALLDQLYWVAGSVLGALIGELFKFNTAGVEFAMTALFVVIFIEQWLETKNHFPAISGAVCGIASLLIFGPDNFILPSLIAAIACLLSFRAFRNTRKGAEQ